MLNRSFGFPEKCILPGSNKVVSRVIGTDETFRLNKHIMKSYTRKTIGDDTLKAIFNYRLSCVRRVTGNTFGLLSKVFRILYQSINLRISTCDDLIWMDCITCTEMDIWIKIKMVVSQIQNKRNI